MDNKYNKIRVYWCAAECAVKTIKEQGHYYVKKEYITNKYKNVSEIFLIPYNFFISNAVKYLDKPKEAESLIWTFVNKKYVNLNNKTDSIVTLEFSIDRVIPFKIKDWNKIQNFKPLDESFLENYEKLRKLGVQDFSDFFTTPYYPFYKNKITETWNRLFRFSKLNEFMPDKSFQCAVWYKQFYNP